MSLVSIIIPCYNYGWLLAETLDSLLVQTHTQWECLIIDDGSTDTSRAVGESYQARDPRFRYVYQKNKGMSAARNHGLRLAQGEYIQFLDADDLLVPEKLAIQSAYLDMRSTVDVIYGDVRYFRHGESTVLSRSSDMRDTPWMLGVQGKGEAVLTALVEKNIMVTPSPLFRSSLLKKVGFFAENLRSMEDWEFWARCVLSGANFNYDPTKQTWALVRVHPTSTSQNLTRMYKYEIKARQILQLLLTSKGYVNAARLNNIGIAKAVNSIADRARKKIVEKDISAGMKDYFYLAYVTKKYAYYLKNLGYWLVNG